MKRLRGREGWSNELPKLNRRRLVGTRLLVDDEIFHVDDLAGAGAAVGARERGAQFAALAIATSTSMPSSSITCPTRARSMA